MLGLTVGLIVGLVLGAKFHEKLTPLLNAAQERVTTWTKAITNRQTG